MTPPTPTEVNDRVRAATHDYVAFAPCGCARGVAVDMADRFTGRAVAKWIADGYRVERMSHDDFRGLGFGRQCPHTSAQGEQLTLLAEYPR